MNQSERLNECVALALAILALALAAYLGLI